MWHLGLTSLTTESLNCFIINERIDDEVNPFKPEFTIVIFIHYKPRIAVAILDFFFVWTAFAPFLEHCTPSCVCTNNVSETGVKSASCNPKEVTAKQKLCSENKGELKTPMVYIVFSRRRKESSVGEETTWSGRLFQTGIVQGKKENL